MAYSYNEYTGDGSTDDFSVTFDYLQEADVKIYINGVEDTGAEFTSPGVIHTSTVPPAGANVYIERRSELSQRAVDFTTGSLLTEEDLDTSAEQVFKAAQEAIDAAERALSLDYDGLYDADSRRIKNLTDPVNDQDAVTKNYLENEWLTPSDKAQLNAIDAANVDIVANDIANVDITADNITNVNNVGGSISNVNTVSDDITNVNTTATNIADVNTVATNIGDINTVENSITNVNTTATNIADVNTVATNIGDINTVENSIANVNKVGTDIANVNTTAGSIANVNTVATNVADVNTTAGDIANVNTVAGNIANVNAVADNETNINAVQANEANINAVNANSGNINTVASNNTNVTTVADNITDVSLAATNISDIQTIATEVAKVITVANDLNEATSEIDVVAASIDNVDAVGNDIDNVNFVASNIASVNAFGETYFVAATAPSSPTEGDLWFDTANDKMMVYNGGSWQNAGSSVNGTAARFKFVATASQTAFSGTDANGATLAYDSGYIDVYLNGVHLDPSDYTATDGSTITLASGAAAGDELYVVAFGTFTLASHYTKTEVDGLLAGVDATALKDSSGNTVVDASSGNVGIGTTPSGSKLHLRNDTSSTYIRFQNSSASDIYVGASESNLVAFNGGSERMRIAADGKVGIGTSSPAKDLHIYSAIGDYPLRIESGDSKAAIQFVDSSTVTAPSIGGIGDDLIIDTSATERMRIDSSGNLLVGKTVTASSTVGAVIGESGYITTTRDSAEAARFTRLTSDGDIVSFRKDGTTVGSIATQGGDIQLGTGVVGIRFKDNDNAIQPQDLTTSSARDAATDLGQSNARFKDLYLSGGVYLGGTGSANKLDDYEMGDWTPLIYGSTTAGSYSSVNTQGAYVKVGDLVWVTFYFYGLSGTGSGDLRLSGLPFTIDKLESAGIIQANSGLIFTSGYLPTWMNSGGTQLSGRATNPTGGGYANVPYPVNPGYFRGNFCYRTTA
jgi:hypothetical protein